MNGRAIGSRWQGPPGFQRERAAHPAPRVAHLGEDDLGRAVGHGPNGLSRRVIIGRRVAQRKSPLRQLDVIEMGSIVDAPDQDAAIVYINLIDATGILGEPPIGRERKIC